MTIDGGSAPLGAVSVDGIDRGMRDGAAVHAAALAAGFSTRLLPRQVLQVWTPREETTSFTHGIPQSTTLAAVTYSQDLRMRRGLLGHEGIPQPRGATFPVGRARGTARKYARRIGYPVTVKPALGDSTISVKPHVRNEIELDEAFDELLIPLCDRPGHTEAAYGITELRKPGWRKGKETVPPGYRVLVEEQIPGRYLRVLVLRGKIVSVVDCPDGPWGTGTSPVENLGELEGPVMSVVRGVTGAIPGLKVMSIDLVVPDDSAAARDESGEPLLVDLSERPWLEVQHRLDPQSAERLAQRILGTDLSRDAIGAPRSWVQTQARFERVVDPAAFTEAVSSYAGSLSLEADLEVTDSALGHVGGSLSGDPKLLAETAEVILDEGIQSQSAMKARLSL